MNIFRQNISSLLTLHGIKNYPLQGPFKNDVTAKRTIFRPPSLPCHHENNLNNISHRFLGILLTSLPPFLSDVIFERPRTYIPWVFFLFFFFLFLLYCFRKKEPSYRFDISCYSRLGFQNRSYPAQISACPYTSTNIQHGLFSDST